MNGADFETPIQPTEPAGALWYRLLRVADQERLQPLCERMNNVIVALAQADNPNQIGVLRPEARSILEELRSLSDNPE